MSLVGPRPEVPRYVDLDDPLWSEVLEATPGLTDPIAITLRDEESVMAQVRDERESFYLRTLQKYKLLGSVEYLRKRTWKSDVEILARTMVAIVLPHSARPPDIEEITRTVERHRNGHGG
jgi:lipopolysaccharide/colanic/teichoic acid biosynthesis glycosyltransferase